MDRLVANASKALWEKFMQKHTENLPASGATEDLW
jgi:hypothetical protein